jgi:hypothetical protein
MIRRFALLLFFALGSFELDAKEICDENATNCATVSSAAPWLLSIIETSISSCPPSVTVTTWLNDNRWLVDKVKSQEPQYNQFIEMQQRVFWASNNPDIKVTCDRVVKLVSKTNPLAQDLR